MNRLSARQGWATLLALLLAMVMTQPARADCTTSSATASLGTVSSFAAAASAQGTTASSGIACSGSGTLTLITTNTITATIQSATGSNGNQPRLHDPATGDYLPFLICRDASCAATYQIGNQITWTSTTFLGLLNLFTGPGSTLPLYFRTVPGTQVAAGTYTSTVTIAWNWNICSVGALICLVRDTGTGTSTVTLSLVVERDCAITAPPVDFGSAPLVGSFDPVTRTITLLCSKDAAYTVGINNGLHASGGVRRLSNGGAFIAYDLFYPAASGARWGATGGERRGSGEATTNAGIYNGTTSQTYTYRAEIAPNQPTPAAGTHTDTLTLDVQF
ncbi:Csu type fimbrial protein [Novosphingobium album (ex Liu et al. 2023)]|nr:spore coat U domain-containing protein [Novosphingobium album (ex Liu et al. 2023)]